MTEKKELGFPDNIIIWGLGLVGGSSHLKTKKMIEIKETSALDYICVGEVICYRHYDLDLKQFVEFARGTSERIMNYYLIVLELNGKYKLHYLAKTGNVLIGPDCVESYEDTFFNQPIDYWKDGKKYQWNPFE